MKRVRMWWNESFRAPTRFSSVPNHCFPSLLLGPEGMFLKGLPYSLKHIQMHWFSLMSRSCHWTEQDYDALRAWAMHSLAETGDPKATGTSKCPVFPCQISVSVYHPTGAKSNSGWGWPMRRRQGGAGLESTDHTQSACVFTDHLTRPLESMDELR